MRISATGNKGFSLVEVLVTLAVIGACYVSIAKGLIENMQVNRRIEDYSKYLLTAGRYFTDFKDSEETNVHTSAENSDNGFTIHTIEFRDGKDNKILDFKEYTLEIKK
jgi:prepilin-type N-terminal cleavage/methylation domain-containing protein